MAHGGGILELQRAEVLRMLNIGDDERQVWGGSQTPKVLVYDNFCKEVVAPLLSIGGLRNHGVTLHLSIENARQPVADVPAVYFVEPTAKNIKRILEDLEQSLYHRCYVNFASAATQPLLEDLAKGSLQSRAAQKVAGLFDRHISFVSLSQSLFTLNLPKAYTLLHSPSSDDQIVEQYLERIVDGLVSVFATIRAMPIIRCPPGNESPVAEAVARRLQERIRELLRDGPQAADLFSASASGGALGASVDAGLGAPSQRPLLCILGRDVDLLTMVHHTWTYQAMTHDLFGLRLNRLTVPVGDTDSAAPPKPRSYDVDDSDAFWTRHAGAAFPEVGPAVHQAVEEYKRKSSDMSTTKEGPTQSLVAGLAEAINTLPEMGEKKRSIDMHTNIARALLSEIRARELDKYYAMEEQFSTQSVGTSVKSMEEILSESQKGTPLDKTRALMCLYLSQPSMEAAKLQGLTAALAAAGGEAEAIAYLQHLHKIKSVATPMPSAGPSAQTESSGAGLMGSLGRLASNAASASEGILAAGLKGVKDIVATDQETPVVQIMGGLMEQKSTGITENYLYLDPRAQAGGEVPRIRAPFRRGIAFVIGGGSYTEMQSLHEWGQKRGRQVGYGSTDMVSPSQFVEELAGLGKAI